MLTLVFLPVLAAVGLAIDRNYRLIGLGSRDAIAGGVALRPMPLGASITQGLYSSDSNGYRDDLRLMLRTAGNPVNFVGNQQIGSMADNQHEGWPGFVLADITNKAKASVPKWLPNLVLINAGTNDAIQNRSVATAGQRMQTMVDYVLATVPDATVLLSTLIVNANADTEKHVEAINDQYRALVVKMAAAGKHVLLAEMHGADGPTKDELADGVTHPNDAGYEKMARIWFRTVQQASALGWIKKPHAVKDLPDNGPD